MYCWDVHETSTGHRYMYLFALRVVLSPQVVSRSNLPGFKTDPVVGVAA